MSAELKDSDAWIHRLLCLEAERARRVAEATSLIASETHARWMEAERKAEGFRQRRLTLTIDPPVRMEIV